MEPSSLLLGAVREAASKHKLDPVLVAAIVQKESGWNHLAIRFEPEYRWLWPSRDAIYRPAGVSAPTEVMQQKASWGLMQVMGAVARERGCLSPFLTSLLSPAIGLEFGCAHLAHLARRFTGNDLISAYNAGRPVDFNRKVYVDPVLQNMEALRPLVEEG